MPQNLRSQVLRAFKSLHRTRQKVFEGDSRALEAARLKINEEYHKARAVTDTEAIRELVNHSKAVEHELNTTVIQAKEVRPGEFETRLRDDVVKLDNVPFKDCH